MSEFCTAEQRATCPLKRHFEDTHHQYWPRRLYQSPLEKEFRDLEDNKIELCRSEHDELHRTTSPPEKPSQDEMIMAIKRSKLARTVIEKVS